MVPSRILRHRPLWVGRDTQGWWYAVCRGRILGSEWVVWIFDLELRLAGVYAQCESLEEAVNRWESSITEECVGY